MTTALPPIQPTDSFKAMRTTVNELISRTSSAPPSRVQIWDDFQGATQPGNYFVNYSSASTVAGDLTTYGPPRVQGVMTVPTPTTIGSYGGVKTKTGSSGALYLGLFDSFDLYVKANVSFNTLDDCRFLFGFTRSNGSFALTAANRPLAVVYQPSVSANWRLAYTTSTDAFAATHYVDTGIAAVQTGNPADWYPVLHLSASPAEGIMLAVDGVQMPGGALPWANTLNTGSGWELAFQTEAVTTTTGNNPSGVSAKVDYVFFDAGFSARGFPG